MDLLTTLLALAVAAETLSGEDSSNLDKAAFVAEPVVIACAAIAGAQAGAAAYQAWTYPDAVEVQGR